MDDVSFNTMTDNANTRDKEFDEYVEQKCISIVANSKEYIDNEKSGEYSEEELSVMRERLIFKAAWYSAINFIFAHNKL